MFMELWTEKLSRLLKSLNERSSFWVKEGNPTRVRLSSFEQSGKGGVVRDSDI